MNTIGDGLRAMGKSIQDLGDFVDDPKVQQTTIDAVSSVATYANEMNKVIMECTKKCSTVTECQKCVYDYNGSNRSSNDESNGK